MPQNGGGKGWVTDPDSGVKVMPDHWREFLEWLLLGPEREPKTQKAWAVDHDVHEDSLRRWKRDPRFRKEWEARAAELNVHVERVQTVIDAVYREAAKGDVKAASLYLQYVDRFTPKRQVIVDEAEASALSDGALITELEDLLDALRDGE
tara:strand:- start:272 stop:721 length:450 start_codon:yes stop_codon:yes gene_type:complete